MSDPIAPDDLHARAAAACGLGPETVAAAAALGILPGVVELAVGMDPDGLALLAALVAYLADRRTAR